MFPSWFEPMIWNLILIVPIVEKGLWTLMLAGFQRMVNPPEALAAFVDMKLQSLQMSWKMISASVPAHLVSCLDSRLLCILEGSFAWTYHLVLWCSRWGFSSLSWCWGLEVYLRDLLDLPRVYHEVASLLDQLLNCFPPSPFIFSRDFLWARLRVQGYT